MHLERKILDTIDYYGMLRTGSKVLVAVSGGADSVFLAYVLNRLKRKLGIKLYLAHLDHGIRGAESRRDALFVKKLADKLGIKLYSGRLKPAHAAKRAKARLSLEEELRNKRYAFFKKAAASSGARTVVTAHTLDDQAETVLMRVIKGTALKGLIGIHPVRTDGIIRFARPLIEIEKSEITNYLKNEKIPFRTDSTNRDDKFLRNRIRNKVLPYLEKINPQIRRSLSNLADSLREDFEFIESEKKKIDKMVKTGKHARHIPLADILLQHKALRKEIAREALKSVGGNIKKLTFRHWKDIDGLIRTKKSGKSLDLPGAVKISKTAEKLIFAKTHDII
ncbi:MAG: tRNA lysidine(34) synthetase TilS [Candidatus Omnitrophica bacterium]|nr:tRNA lysidine(34) synthetase TilS [Candidatus Omnitrophota bacterium]